MARRKSSKPAARSACSPEVLPPAVVIDAPYLHGIALSVRRHVQTAVISTLLEIMMKEAARGQMECLFIPEVRGLDPATRCEALQPELHRRGLCTQVINHEIQRLGMRETKTALAVSWRNLR